MRRGLATRKLLIAAALAAALPAVGLSVWPRLSWSTADAGPMMYCVERGDFVHEITERGNVESADNVEIRCEVKSKSAGGTTILEIVPEGTVAKKGDVLVRLDSSALENDRTSQMIVCKNSEASLIQAQKTLETAQISKDEYLKGQYKQAEQTAKIDICAAQEDLRKAKDYLVYSERLAAKGYMPQQQLEADKFAVEKAKNTLAVAETKLEVLQKFTKEKMIVQLDSDIKTAEAKLTAIEATHKLDMASLALIESQLAKCVIKAPQDGQVVYASVTGWRGTKELIIDAGEQVRERQVLIRLPDARRMQVVAKINEAKVALVRRGTPATIRLDAFSDMELHGTVEKVDEFPVPASFFGSSVKEYETVVRIKDSPPGLRPGLTAEVRIRVEHDPNVIQAPVQAVFEHGDKYYCLTCEQNRFFAREVKVGTTNDKTVVIRGGLSEGEQIVLNAGAYRDRVKLPAVPTETERAVARAARQESVSAPQVVQASPAVGSPARKPDETVEKADRMFRELDKRHQGKLLFVDLPENLRSRLRSADKDGDGALDRGEWMAAIGHVLKQSAGVAKAGAGR
jgi:RND family efflux transporter MFP subunit